MPGSDHQIPIIIDLIVNMMKNCDVWRWLPILREWYLSFFVQPCPVLRGGEVKNGKGWGRMGWYQMLSHVILWVRGVRWRFRQFRKVLDIDRYFSDKLENVRKS